MSIFRKEIKRNQPKKNSYQKALDELLTFPSIPLDYVLNKLLIDFMQAKQKEIFKFFIPNYFNNRDEEEIKKWSITDKIYIIINLISSINYGSHGLVRGLCPFCIYIDKDVNQGCDNCTYGKNHGICTSCSSDFGIIMARHINKLNIDKPFLNKVFYKKQGERLQIIMCHIEKILSNFNTVVYKDDLEYISDILNGFNIATPNIRSLVDSTIVLEVKDKKTSIIIDTCYNNNQLPFIDFTTFVHGFYIDKPIPLQESKENKGENQIFKKDDFIVRLSDYDSYMKKNHVYKVFKQAVYKDVIYIKDKEYGENGYIKENFKLLTKEDLNECLITDINEKEWNIIWRAFKDKRIHRYPLFLKDNYLRFNKQRLNWDKKEYYEIGCKDAYDDLIRIKAEYFIEFMGLNKNNEKEHPMSYSPGEDYYPKFVSEKDIKKEEKIKMKRVVIKKPIEDLKIGLADIIKKGACQDAVKRFANKYGNEVIDYDKLVNEANTSDFKWIKNNFSSDEEVIPYSDCNSKGYKIYALYFNNNFYIAHRLCNKYSFLDLQYIHESYHGREFDSLPELLNWCLTTYENITIYEFTDLKEFIKWANKIIEENK